MPTDKKSEWDWEIKHDQSWFNLNIREIFHYKDLLIRFVRRDIIASYQQTILGPIWVFLQPLLTALVYYLIFSRIANISTDGIKPAILFYLPGSIIWTYFSDCLTGTMNTFVTNAYIFNKVYFPRLIAPLSNVLFHTFRLSFQLIFFFLIYLFFLVVYRNVHPSLYILLLPLLILQTAIFALGAGLIISVLTAKYRDLDNIINFLMRLFMFVSPIVYPVSIIPEKYKFLFWMNPLTAIIETFRSAFFSNHPVYGKYLLLSGFNSIVLLLAGLVFFHKREIKVMDVV
ncbi:MAG: ABC transporter permease [Bacteroidetes bacterium]|nr:MAG: ABC transporter permease [Bacteroidota bacterium]